MTVGILLVGGFGTRLAPLTRDTPKPMLPIAGIPVTEHQLEMAKKAGISRVVLATSYLSETFTPYFGDGSRFGMQLSYAVEESPLGTGGAIRNAAQLLEGDETIVVLNGDVLSRHDLSQQIRFHIKNKADVTLHLTHVADARAYGCVPIDSNGRVKDFLEKMENPITNTINAGCYVFNSRVIDAIQSNQVVSIERDVFPKLVSEGKKVFGYVEDSYWLDIGTPRALLQGSIDYVNGDFKAMNNVEIDSTALLTGGTCIGSDSLIGSQVRIDSSIIGAAVTIESGAVLQQCYVAPGTTIPKNSHFTRSYCANDLIEPLNL
ncbi:unannotated protein [freshwater metagenome]|uniref:Unannotated protein n=1 Tax=freshwater metagenome TaxID=449393 RepID=A0A6J7XR36_9ZZZZ|nr:NTP transferase domain-containing protein [Actinomycetota bacterium]